MSSSLYTHQTTICAKNSLITKTKGRRGDKNATVFQNQPNNIYENGSNKGEICILGVGWGPLSHIISEGSRVFTSRARLIVFALGEERK
jgi:hypothetical protein